MPIAFPAPSRGGLLASATSLISGKPPGFIPAPNLGNPGLAFSAATLGPGRGIIAPRANPRNPGVNYAFAFALQNLEQTPQPLTDARLYRQDEGTLNMTLAGISYDATGAPLGNCQVLIYRTADKSLVAETTSDASGNWSISLLKGGPFFLVEYKVGSPDVFGTSPNNLVPVQA